MTINPLTISDMEGRNPAETGGEGREISEVVNNKVRLEIKDLGGQGWKKDALVKRVYDSITKRDPGFWTRQLPSGWGEGDIKQMIDGIVEEVNREQSLTKPEKKEM